MPYCFEIELFAKGQHLSWYSGDVEAERYSSACIQAWERIDKHVTALARVLSEDISVGELKVERKESE